MVVVAEFPLKWATRIRLLWGFISASDAGDVLFRSNPMPPIGVLFAFLVADVVMSVEVFFMKSSTPSIFLILLWVPFFIF